jgi:hypothetical protein
MTAPTVAVTVKLADFGGPAVAGVKVTATLSAVDYMADGTFVSTEPVTATTDVNGSAVLQLFPNATAPAGLGTLGTTVRVRANIPSSRHLDVRAAIPNNACNLVDVLVEDDPSALSAISTALLAGAAGSSYVGFMPVGSGAVQQTVQSWARKRPLPSDYGTNAEYVAAVQALATNQHFTQNGATIHRLADRVFIGGAIDNDGTFPNVLKDWLTTYQNGLPVKRNIGAANSGVTTLGSPIVTFTSNGVLPSVGAAFFGDFAIPSGATVLSVDSATQITLSANATASTTGNSFFSSDATITGGSGVSAGAFGITNNSPASAIGALYASRSQKFNSAGTACIGLMAMAVNDHATLSPRAWGFYVEAHRLNNTVGATYGIEIDVLSTSAAGEIAPNSFRQPTTGGLQIGAGCGLAGVLPSGTQVDCGAAIQIVANPRRFKAGIVIANNSIFGTDGVTVSAAPAVAMAPGHSLEWNNKDQALVGRLMATNTDPNAKTELRFTSAGVQALGATSQPLFLVNHVANAANYVAITPAIAGSAAAVSAVGTDANRDLRLVPGGTGRVRFGTFTAGALAVTGSVEIKDDGGTVRRVLIG